MEYLIVIFLGLLLGSFTTAISFRVPRGIPWAFQNKKTQEDEKSPSAYRSACPECGHELTPIELVPVFSWLFQKGCCRACHKAIPIRYPLIELGVVITLLAAFYFYGFTAEFFFIAAILPILWALMLIDLEYLILPNQLVAILAVVGAIRLIYFSVFEVYFSLSEALSYVAAAVIFGGFIWVLGTIMSKILKKDSLGFGDVKFFAVTGLWHGLTVLPIFAMMSGVLGIVFAVIWQWKTKKQLFPFGPALIASFYLLFLFDGSQFF